MIIASQDYQAEIVPQHATIGVNEGEDRGRFGGNQNLTQHPNNRTNKRGQEFELRDGGTIGGSIEPIEVREMKLGFPVHPSTKKP